MVTLKEHGYKTVRIQSVVYNEIEIAIRRPDSMYRSVSEFVHEALRLRLEQLKVGKRGK